MTEAIAIENITLFMKERRYNFTVEQILAAYTDYFKKGYYISSTTRDSIQHLTEELEFLYQYKREVSE